MGAEILIQKYTPNELPFSVEPIHRLDNNIYLKKKFYSKILSTFFTNKTPCNTKYGSGYNPDA